MTQRILAACSPGEVRVAVVRDDELQDYAIWRPGVPDGVGDLYRGRVLVRIPAMAGSFVALDGTDGFLPDSEGGAGCSVGDIVPVRVTRAAQGGKGPRLSARLAAHEIAPAKGPGALVELAGRYPDAPVLIDDDAVAARLQPVLGARIGRVANAFDDEVEEQVETLSHPEVPLRGGGQLHIQPTSALVAIDVDAGAAVGSRAGKNVHMTANLAVLPVLVRHIHLRNLSGAILVDFAGLSPRRRTSLAPALSAALADDPLHPRLLGFTSLGLAEIVRPRVHAPLHELLAGPLAAGFAALRRIAAETAARPHLIPALRGSPAVVSALETEATALQDLARRTGRGLILRSDPALATVAWTIEMSDART